MHAIFKQQRQVTVFAVTDVHPSQSLVASRASGKNRKYNLSSGSERDDFWQHDCTPAPRFSCNLLFVLVICACFKEIKV